MHKTPQVGEFCLFVSSVNLSFNSMATFAGDKKVGVSILHRWEKAFVQWMTPRVPKGIETYHLTLMTIPISLGIILCGYFGQANIQWLWGSSFLNMLQWLTDSLDGSVG